MVLSEPASSSAYFPQYSIFIFSAFLEQEIAKHAVNKPDNPLFVYASFQNVHAPLEVPRRFFDLYKSQGADVPGGADCLWNKTSGNGKHGSTGFKCDTDDSVPGLPGKTGFRGQACYCNRLIVKAQVSALDEAVRNLTRALQTAGLWENSVLVLQGDNGGPTFEAHSNFPLRGGKLNFFEGGVRTAGFVNSPLLPAATAGSTYAGILHTCDWYATFSRLANAPLPAPDDPSLAISGIDAWPALVASRPGLDSSDAATFRAQAAAWLDDGAPVRTEALITDGILRVGKWKLVVGGDQKDQGSPFLRDCTVGTDGGWSSPPSDRSSNRNLCPSDIYTRPPKGGKSGVAEPTTLGCSWSWGGHVHGLKHRYIGFTNATDAADAWLCGSSAIEGPCTPEHPCLWDVVTDPSEREEVAAANPTVVASLKARLAELAKDFQTVNSTMVFPTAGSDFCKAAAARTHDGRQFCGPWYEMPDGVQQPETSSPARESKPAAELPARVVGWDRGYLLKLRAQIRASGTVHASLQPALHALSNAAKEALALEPPSVVAGGLIPGCDNCSRHDLWGLATYAWPCGTQCNASRYSKPHECDSWWKQPHYKPPPAKWGDCDNETGLPWEQHDGYVHDHSTGDPDMVASDAMSDAVSTLALAHYLLGNAQFGAKAAQLLQVWFLDNNTHMNPNLDHTAIIPGVSEHNGSCIVTSHRWNSRLTDSVALLCSTGALTAETASQLDGWNARFLDWLLTSKTGRKEANMKQNHATWHTVESAALAHSTNDTATAVARLARLTEDNATPALGHQIEPSGVMPFEVARNDGIGYSCMNIAALFTAATIGRSLKMTPDLFTFTNTTGSGSIRKALDFLLQFATNASKPWPYSQSTMAPPWTELAPQMLIAARVYDEPRYEHMIKQLPWPGGKHWPQQKSWDVDVSRLLFPSHIPDDEVR